MQARSMSLRGNDQQQFAARFPLPNSQKYNEVLNQSR